MRTLALLILLACPLAQADDPEPPAERKLPSRVLFVGNSFIFFNDMPKMLRQLAAADGRKLETGQHTPGGFTLQRHAAAPELAKLLEQRWDVVVMHEQSQMPSFPPDAVAKRVVPFAKQLADAVRKAGARPALMLTWAYREGDRRNRPQDTFAAMQGRLLAGYKQAGAAAKAPVLPAGLAWKAALEAEPKIDLWTRDGRHPNPLGSYLAACVIYRALGGEVGKNSFHHEFGKNDAEFLQRLVAKLDVPSLVGD